MIIIDIILILNFSNKTTVGYEYRKIDNLIIKNKVIIK